MKKRSDGPPSSTVVILVFLAAVLGGLLTWYAGRTLNLKSPKLPEVSVQSEAPKWIVTTVVAVDLLVDDGLGRVVLRVPPRTKMLQVSTIDNTLIDPVYSFDDGDRQRAENYVVESQKHHAPEILGIAKSSVWIKTPSGSHRKYYVKETVQQICAALGSDCGDATKGSTLNT